MAEDITANGTESTGVRRDAQTGEEIVHEYDGILEADNQLPRWWLGVFFGSVIFGVLYWFYYQAYEISPVFMPNINGSPRRPPPRAARR